MPTETIRAELGDDSSITNMSAMLDRDDLGIAELDVVETILLDRIIAYITLGNRLTARRAEMGDRDFRKDWRQQLLHAPIPSGALWITRIGADKVPATVGLNRAIECYEDAERLREDAEKLRFLLLCMARRHRNNLDMLERRYRGTEGYALRASLAFHHALEIEKMLEEIQM